jgi:dipeptidyl aminopeptidase/acylaminoacyl peptidase
MQDDVTDGVKAMIDQGLADPQRICIVGASYGGYAALAGAAFTPELYACAASINGVSDLPYMIGHVTSHWGDESNSLSYWRDHIGAAQDPSVIARSPARAAGRVRAPILLLHSADDTVVPIVQSEVMATALKENGKRYTFTKLPADDHWLSRSESRVRMLVELETFLAAALAPKAN